MMSCPYIDIAPAVTLTGNARVLTVGRGLDVVTSGVKMGVVRRDVVVVARVVRVVVVVEEVVEVISKIVQKISEFFEN